MEKKTAVVVYRNEEEIIVCTPETESRMLALYFGRDNRNTSDYRREVYEAFFNITSQIRINDWL